MLIPLFCFIFPVKAQFYQGSQVSFGKNKVQYIDFLWTFYRFKKFDTYFYLGGQNLASYTGQVADQNLNEIEKLFDYKLDGRLQFIIYNKLSDLKQSNINSEGEEQYNIGGITRIIGNKILLYFNGSHSDFESQIKAGIAQVLINQIMYGGSVRDRIQNAALLTLPDWYIQGLVSYVSRNWGVEIDNRMKDGMLKGKYKKFNRLSGADATLAGHAIWNYIVSMYGESSVSNLLYMTSINRNIESGFIFVLGSSLKSLSKNWLEFYEKRYLNADKKRSFSTEHIEVKNSKAKFVYSQLEISRNLKYSSFVTNELGKYKVWIHNNETQKSKRIIKDGYKSLTQKLDESFPVLAWHPSAKVLTVIRERRGKILLGTYTPETKKWEENPIFNFEKILDFAYSDNGQSIVISAVQRGHTDIFVYNLRTHMAEQITKDAYDDLNPRFINNSEAIIFSSNRTNDTLGITVKDESLMLSANTDIYIYDYKKKSRVLKRITDTPLANEKQPFAYDSTYITYLSDENGIYNRYLAHLDSVISYVDTSEHYRYIVESYPQTNYPKNIISHEIDYKNGKYSEVIFDQGKYKLYRGNLPKAASLTNYAPLEKTSYMSFKLKMLTEGQKEESLSSDTITKASEKKTITDESTIKNDSNKVDINNYTFQSEVSKPKNKILEKKNEKGSIDSINTADKKVKSEFKLPKQRNYETAFTANYVMTQLDNSLLNTTYQAYTGGAVYFNPGLTGLLKIGVSDLFEDQKVVGAFRFSGDPNTGNEYLLSYENQKKRLDKQIVFYRQSSTITNLFSLIKNNTHELKYINKWPLNDVSAIRGTVSYRHDRRVYLSTDLQNLQESNAFDNWTSLKCEYIFDNTINKGLNLYNGTRYKVFLETFQKVNIPNPFSKTTITSEVDPLHVTIVGLDFRHYIKVHRDIIWANRLAASTSLGENKLLYYLGSVDNWINLGKEPVFNTSIPVDNTQNYIFQTLATNMRGFSQNIRNGNSFVVINSELRIPVFKYFLNRPIKSDFLKNFQVVGFGDIGTAWEGSSPYAKENSFNTQIIEQGPLTITLTSQKEPIVAGYGWGLRSRILGYFVRTDWAWGVEDGIILPSIFYLSLSLDF